MLALVVASILLCRAIANGFQWSYALKIPNEEMQI